ncbi:hypothetical protein BCR33DRAFT_743418 [Rhizoclosmatium globosum]|uniref:Integrase catalytic domain-containing protein n=1 Tax=Rhizoclosmatium globosum TaxID=329046 RepID=A0A1Y2BIU4_9FUNG|nr:hypothetical protein BCR33DRAFT_743418 [Rhizoclosmatium globosum]|eukprot:ORY34477.1 hypothetical protein BCR33DRAFT_743418 [Rhizoclosmatium globosum]
MKSISNNPLDNHIVVATTKKVYGLHFLPTKESDQLTEPTSHYALLTAKLSTLKVSDLTSEQLERIATCRHHELQELLLRHRRLGHAAVSRIAYMQNKNTSTYLVPIKISTKDLNCEICHQSTANHNPVKGKPSQTYPVGQFWSFDTLSISLPHENKIPYLTGGIDQGSDMFFKYNHEHKDETLVNLMRILENAIEIHGHKPKFVRVDGELGSSHSFREYCKARGIDLQVTAQKHHHQTVKLSVHSKP